MKVKRSASVIDEDFNAHSQIVDSPLPIDQSELHRSPSSAQTTLKVEDDLSFSGESVKERKPARMPTTSDLASPFARKPVSHQTQPVLNFPAKLHLSVFFNLCI